MNAIVTGGAGFLGSHLCEALIKKGYQVVCVDNLLTGNKDNISHLLDHPDFKFIEMDVLNINELEVSHVDFVYHLASPASPNKHSKKSYHALAFETMQVNSMGTWAVSEFAMLKGAKMLFASTSEAYGEPLEHPQKETYRGNVSTTGPRAVYDESKRFGETIVSAYVREKQLDGRIIRIFNTYGPKMALDDGRVVIEFVIAALKNEGLPVFGDGNQTRSFCYVSDLIEGIIRAMETDNTKGEIFNLGNPHEFTVLELAQKIIQKTNSQSAPEMKEELPQDDPSRRCPDISKAKQILAWEPHIELDQGLDFLIDDVRKRLI
jgi:nucleoside-diphosphate-sugar epimerase